MGLLNDVILTKRASHQDNEYTMNSSGYRNLQPHGSEQHEVLHFVSIPIRILLYCRQNSRFFRWLKTCYYKKKKLSPLTSKAATVFVGIKTVQVVGYQQKYANENGGLDLCDFASLISWSGSGGFDAFIFSFICCFMHCSKSSKVRNTSGHSSAVNTAHSCEYGP